MTPDSLRNVGVVSMMMKARIHGGEQVECDDFEETNRGIVLKIGNRCSWIRSVRKIRVRS
ncbi:hypothetical protein SAMN05421858_0347 [Haladaptatus litoreus]|uniref:Uncharacterized protein n=1 Tax=Haladaptatus litoreus TaxID=553468 RepID=A0A1N6VGP3_9EURY|nr:hypothetical protein SAMN05421858_0347 [Haladaptatus litoreus]